MATPVRIVFLGGLGEIGRNCMAIEQGTGDDRRLLLIDCGLMFPDADMHGIDLVLPDFTYLRENADRIVAVVATHGHEDHVGALQYLLRELSFPIYGSAVALGLARNRIEEHAIAVHTPQGVVLHSGDFKIDLTPVDGRRTDLARLGQIAATEGIRLLMADSTNAEEHGHSPSESGVGAVLRSVFGAQKGRRIITASFASHLHRIQQIADAAVDSGRKVATQGEPMSALALLARGESKWVKAGDHDTVILSSHAIPGNEGNVNRVIDDLLRAGVEVVHSGVADVHATGHAQADELKTYMSLTRPEWLVPIHGEYRHMVANAKLGVVMGVPADNVLICEDGDVLELSDAGLAKVGRVPAGYLYVDGIVGDVGQGVLRDRRVLAEEGVVVVIVTVDIGTGKVLTGPEIITRGWVYAPEAEDLLDEACDRVAAVVEQSLAAGVRDVESLERDVRRAAGKFVNERTKRRPMIVPVVMET